MDEESVINLSEETQEIIKIILLYSKTNLPIKYSDIVQHLHSKSIKTIRTCHPEVSKYLEHTFGYKLVALTDASTPRYLLYMEKPNPSMLSEKQNKKRTFLKVVLTILLLEYNRISEHELERYLEMLEINLNQEHDIFGADLRKLLTDTFVKEMYIKKDKRMDKFGTTRLIYSWGVRSQKEFEKKDLIKECAEFCQLPISEMYDEEDALDMEQVIPQAQEE